MASLQQKYVSKEEKKVITDFLKTYKEHRCLWDMNHDMYTHKDARNSAYKILLQVMKKIYPDATIPFIKKKIENMRCAYKREVRKVKESASAGIEPLYRPRLWYFKDMAFLEENDVFRRKRSIWEEDGNSCDIIEVKSEPGSRKEVHRTSISENDDAFENLDTSAEDDLPPPTPQKERGKPLIIKKENFIQEPLQNVVEAPHASLSLVDEWDIIGKSIGLQLRQLNGDQQDIANKLIAEIIFYGKRNRLTDSSSISLCEDPPQT